MSTRGRKLRGAVYILLALFLAVATVSFFLSWPSHENWLGRVGYHLSALVVQKTFGLASLGISFLLFIYGLRLWKVDLLPWWKTFWSVLFWMVWFSTVVAYFVGVVGKGSDTASNYAGVTGDFIAAQLYNLIRWGTLVVLLFIAVVFLVFVHKVRVKMPEIDLKRITSTLQSAPAEREEKTEKSSPESGKTSVEAEVYDNDDNEPFDEEELEEDSKEEAEKPETVTFTIDDEFARVNERAQRGGDP